MQRLRRCVANESACERWADATRHQLQAALAVLSAPHDWSDANQRQLAEQLAERQDALLALTCRACSRRTRLTLHAHPR